MSRTNVYLDGGPLSDGIRGQGMSMDLDWRGLLQSLIADEQLGEVHLVISQLPEQPYPVRHANQRTRLDQWRACGFKVHLSTTEVVSSIFVERGTEAAFATQLLSDAHADDFDTVLIISRRKELGTVLDAVRRAGKRVSVAFFDYRLDPGNPLHAHCDSHQVLTCASLIQHTLSGPKPFFT